MKAMKGNGYNYVALMIIFVFFVLPSLMICYTSFQKIRDEKNLIEVCVNKVIPDKITPSWFLTPQGGLALVGSIFLIVLFLLKDLKSRKTTEDLKFYKKRF